MLNEILKGFEYRTLRKPLIPIPSYKVAKVKYEKWTEHLEYLGFLIPALWLMSFTASKPTA